MSLERQLDMVLQDNEAIKREFDAFLRDIVDMLDFPEKCNMSQYETYGVIKLVQSKARKQLDRIGDWGEIPF